MTNEIRIVLDAKDFECLVNGGILKIKDLPSKSLVQIMLKDIGYDLMHDIIDKAPGAPGTTYERENNTPLKKSI